MAVTCPTCAAENPDGKRFCGDCGGALALACTACGAAIEAGKRFCGDCGLPAGDTAALPSEPTPAEAARPVAERRLTSVLFCDLVGFTTLSEARDAEEVRELLSEYFTMARTVIGRYGGTIEKFIGDAVMAVWGVPVAHEDDAERAVRAGLDLIAGLVGVAEVSGADGLKLRVGILTGEVAVTIGAVGEGMVAGDAVNTAARIQSAAEPGQVWVDETTRSLTAAALTYTDAGEHLLKGKADAVRLYAAGTVVANVGGAQRVDGLEAPFVGRGHELRLVKELFHGAVEDRRPRLAAVSGLAGVGKTRLAWEFEKYVDGIAGTVRWNRSRVLSYGDGVSFWAIAEMVRARLDIADDDPPAIVDAKLAAFLGGIATDPAEREWLHPRLAALLGRESSGFGRDDLFAAWATFFERVNGDDSTALVVDDMQHADPDLLDFFDHLLGSARYPLFVLSLARPELADARPGWGTGRRATPVHLEPLEPDLMAEVVDGLVDGLPETARDTLVERSEGIPLYALEMVRALIDRGAVVSQGGRHVVPADGSEELDLVALAAPPSLQALIAARIDALAPAERQLVQEATAHGLAFSRDGIAATSTVPDLDAVLAELVRKEILELDTDRFSSERGQYRFVQALVRTVAYDTLSLRDRKARHLAVARYLEEGPGEEYAAVIARHYLDALDSGRRDPDIADLTASALLHLERAALRAESLGSPDEALRHYLTALERDPAPADRGRLHEGAARAARSRGRFDDQLAHAEQARAAYQEGDLKVEAGRAAALVGEALADLGELQAAETVMQQAFDELDGHPGAEAAVLELAMILGRVHGTRGDPKGGVFLDRAILLAEAAADWTSLSRALGWRGTLWIQSGSPTIGRSLLEAAVDLGRTHRLTRPTAVNLYNLSCTYTSLDLDEALGQSREGLELARQAGARDLVSVLTRSLVNVLWIRGDWDELDAVAVEHHDDLAYDLDRALVQTTVSHVRLARGEPIELDDAFDFGEEPVEFLEAWMDGIRAAAEGDAARATSHLATATEIAVRQTSFDEDVLLLWPLAIDQALAAGLPDEADRLVRIVGEAPPGLLNPLLLAQLPLFRSLVALAMDPQAAVDSDLEQAANQLRAFGDRFHLARSLLARGRRLAEHGDRDATEPLLAEAEQTFADLRATPWVAKVRRARASVGV